MMKLTVITGNKLKQRMYAQALKKTNFTLQFRDLNLSEIQSNTPQLISLDKVREAYNTIGEPVVVDDIGFYVTKYKSFPGVYFNHIFHGLGKKAFINLFNEGDEARIICSLSYKNASIEKNFIGKLHGKLTKKSKIIDNKNPINSLFIPNGYTKVLHDLPNIKTHRHIAINKFINYINNETH